MKILHRLGMLVLVLAVMIPPVAAMEPVNSAVPGAYAEMFTVPESGSNAQDALFSVPDAVLDTVLQDKSILFFGDSLTSGYGLGSYLDCWSGMLRSRYGMDVTCWSIAASTFGVGAKTGYYPGGCYESMCRRTIPAGNYDVIFVEGGGNDWYCEIPLGTDPASRDEMTFMGALNVTLDRLQERNPKALLLCSTSWNSTGKENGLGLTTDDYNAAMLEVCADRGILCFRACDPQASGIDASDQRFRQQYFLTGSDFWHLNKEGQTRYLGTIAAWLQEMLLEYYVVSPFYDVRLRDWYAPAVAYALDQGITRGTGEHAFSPQELMTRGMMVTLLYRAAGSPDVSGIENPFMDVAPEKYYYEAVLWAYDTGVVLGVTEDSFLPEETLTRQQMVTMLYRYHGAPELQEGESLLEQFSDRAEIRSYAKNAMIWAVGNGVIHGMGDGTVAPASGASRAQMVQILANYHWNLLGQ